MGKFNKWLYMKQDKEYVIITSLISNGTYLGAYLADDGGRDVVRSFRSPDILLDNEYIEKSPPIENEKLLYLQRQLIEQVFWGFG